jgi:hypothetical protein
MNGFMALFSGVVCSAALAGHAADAPRQQAPTDRTAGRSRLHLFILSGQSNMVGLNPDASFTPAVTAAFPGDRIVVVKDARSGQSILKWYLPPSPKDPGGRRVALYTQLMAKVNAAVTNAKPDTVTFVWMQGEADSHPKVDIDYRACLTGLVAFLRSDLGRQDVNVVIGRISDFGNADSERPGWMKVREAQVAFAEADARASWVDTDDLNGPQNGLHYPRDGYLKLGERFAEKAVALIRRDLPRNAAP